VLAGLAGVVFFLLKIDATLCTADAAVATAFAPV
jgi:hypothetical protein